MSRRYHSLQLERQWSFIYMHSLNFRKRPTRSEIGIGISSIDSNQSKYTVHCINTNCRICIVTKKFQHFIDRSNVLGHVLPTFLLEACDVPFTLYYVAVHKLALII